MTSRAWLLILILLTGVAEARHLAATGSVTGPAASLPRHAIGDPRYVPLGPLLYDGASAAVEILDLQKHQIDRVTLARADLVRLFGDAPEGELVSFNAQVAGILLHGAGRYLFVEVDCASGKIRRSASQGRDRVTVIGTDPAHKAAWLARVTGREVTLRRLDLATLVTTDAARVVRPARPATGMEDHDAIVPAPDFARFALVEYVEDGMAMKPPARVYVVDAATGATFHVPALSTTYGVAFSRDGKYLFLGSCQHGTLARVDLAAKKIDLRVAGVQLLHYLVVSPDNTTLFVFDSSRSYVAFDLPTLQRRGTLAHDPALAAAAEEMFDGAYATLDGRHLVMPEALPPGPMTITIGPGMAPPTQQLLIGEFVP